LTRQCIALNLPFFIARRLALAGTRQFARVIIWIATVAVALSVAVMIVASAFIAGFKTEISRKIFEFWGHLHLSDTAYSLSFEPTPIDRYPDFLPGLSASKFVEYTAPETILGFETGREVSRRSHGGVRHIQAFAHKPGIIRTKTDMEGILLRGIGADFDWANLKPYLVAGQPLPLRDTTVADSLRPPRQLIISQSTADRLQIGVGDKMVVHFVKKTEQVRRLFQVCGIYKTGLEEYDRKFALCDIAEVQELLGWNSNQVAGFEVWMDDIRDIDLYNDYIYNEVLPQDMLCLSIRDKFPAIFEWLELQDLNEVVILLLMLAVAIVNMITALLVLVLERTNMIGILKALGARNGSIRRIFLYHAAVITLNGIFWGNVIGLGLCWLQDQFRFIRLNEKDYYLSYAPVKIELASLLTINIGAVTIIVLFLLIPALVIGNISPVRAISFR
jgi:lipoprotein-releasing system permease protein